MSLTDSFEKDLDLLQSQIHALNTGVAVESRSVDAQSKQIWFFLKL